MTLEAKSIRWYSVYKVIVFLITAFLITCKSHLIIYNAQLITGRLVCVLTALLTSTAPWQMLVPTPDCVDLLSLSVPEDTTHTLPSACVTHPLISQLQGHRSSVLRSLPAFLSLVCLTSGELRAWCLHLWLPSSAYMSYAVPALERSGLWGIMK